VLQGAQQAVHHAPNLLTQLLQHVKLVQAATLTAEVLQWAAQAVQV
jgi:hypothetical protein